MHILRPFIVQPFVLNYNSRKKAGWKEGGGGGWVKERNFPPKITFTLTHYTVAH